MGEEVARDPAPLSGTTGATEKTASSSTSKREASRVSFENGRGGKKSFPWLRNLEKGNPPLFYNELGKEAKDLLTKDFTPGTTATYSMLTPVGILLSTVAMKLDDLVMGLVTATIVPKPGVTLELAGGTTGSVQANLKWQDAMPGLGIDLTGTFPLAKSGKAALKYKNQHFTFQAVSGLYPKPPIEVSATVGGFKGDAVLGAEAAYDSETQQIVKATAGAGITKDNCSISALYDIRTKEAVDFLLSQAVDPNLTLALQYTKSFDETPDYMTYGGSYKLDAGSTVKARINSKGTVAAVFSHEFRPNSTISFMTEYDIKQGESKEKAPPKLGVSISIMQM